MEHRPAGLNKRLRVYTRVATGAKKRDVAMWLQSFAEDDTFSGFKRKFCDSAILRTRTRISLELF